MRELAKLVCFNYFVGNCDGHLKNLSLAYSEDWSGLSPAPAYDLVCTTWFPDLSRTMGMALGGESNIDAVTPEHLRASAKGMGIGQREFRSIARTLVELVDAALADAVGNVPRSLDELGWKADDLVDDMAPRKKVLWET